MSDIADHQRDGSAVTNDNGFTGKHSNIPSNTNRVWEVLIECKDKKTTWVDIKDVKEAILIDMAKYAVANQITENLSLTW